MNLPYAPYLWLVYDNIMSWPIFCLSGGCCFTRFIWQFVFMDMDLQSTLFLLGNVVEGLFTIIVMDTVSRCSVYIMHFGIWTCYNYLISAWNCF